MEVSLSGRLPLSCPCINSGIVLEHDGSMSRGDIFFGDNYSFNDTIWQITKAMFVEDTISVSTAQLRPDFDL